MELTISGSVGTDEIGSPGFLVHPQPARAVRITTMVNIKANFFIVTSEKCFLLYLLSSLSVTSFLALM